jgi:hypothetical protein
LVPLLLVTAFAVAPPVQAATAVSVKIGIAPKPITRLTSAAFGWTTHGTVLRTLCALDRHSFQPCSKHKLYKGLKNGLHKFRVEAIGVGTARRIATYRWRVDTLPPAAPIAAGGSLAWLSIGSLPLTGSGSSDSGSGVLRYESRSSSDGGLTWSVGAPGGLVTVTAVGETMAQFRAVDRAGNASAWSPAAGTAAATARIDRYAPSMPTVTGGSLQWQNAVSVDVIGSGSIDVGGAGVDHYEYRTSTDLPDHLLWSSGVVGNDASITALDETLVQFRAVDTAGNASGWAPLFDPLIPNPGSTVRLDRNIPTAPDVAGGTIGWQNIVSTTVTASGGQDSSGSGVAGYEYRSSTDGGATWSSPAAGASLLVSSEGETLVEFRSVDNASLRSSWTQVPVEIDRSNPTDPTVSGGSPAWQSVPSLDIAASGSSDAGGSGLVGYQVRSSTDGGVMWTAAAAGTDLVVSAEGETLVELRAIDGAGNVSSWVQDIARIDSTLPTAPAVSGGSLSWLSVASVAVSASGSTDGGGSSLSGYEYRSSTDAGLTWSAATAGASDVVSSEGATLVQLRSVDGAGNYSAWTPATAGAANSVYIDRTAPTLSSVSGGSLTWKNAASATVTAIGGSDIAGSGFASYQQRTSIDGGLTWTAAAAGGSLAVSTQGETLVQFRALDGAGNTGAWMPAVPGAGDTVRLDRTVPSAPTVTGGSPLWQSVASLDLTASGSADTASGISGYQYRTSIDGGVTWGSIIAGAAATVSAQGTTTVEFRAVDGVGLRSSWVLTSVSIDRTAPGVPTVAGGSNAWQSLASVNVTAGAATDSGGSNVAGYQVETSTDNGSSWTSPVSQSSILISAAGETLVQFRTVDNAGNLSAWAPSSGGAGTVRLDRTLPTDPTVTGGSLLWQSIPSVTLTAGGSTDAGGGLLTGYQRRSSTDGGVSWGTISSGGSLLVTAEGETLVEFRAVDGAGNASNWVQGTSRLDRTVPTTPVVAGGSLAWQNIASLTITGSAAIDGGSGLSGYEYRTSTDAGVSWSAATAGSSALISAEGQTLVQFRSVDVAGNPSAWKPAAAGASNTVRLDRTAPTAPSVSGGSLSWLSVLSVTVTATGGTDSPGSGFAGYQYQTSLDNGANWSPTVAGGSLAVVAQGQTLVRFETLDVAGFASTPTQATVRIDRTQPTAPAVSGGSLSWQSVASVPVSGSSSTDGGGSGLTGYEYRSSTDLGATWSAATAGATDVVSGEGQTLVQLRSIDGAGNFSAWTPTAAGAANTVRLDRTAPGLPTVTGSSLSWLNAPSVTPAAGSATDPGGSGVTGYEFATSTDGGLTWSTPAAGASVPVTAEGETLVEFRSVDAVGNRSAWVQATVRLDHTVPSAPLVAGGSLSWLSVASVAVSGSASVDTGGSGLVGYRYRSSIDNGATWSSATAGASDVISAEGAYLVQFQAFDGAGNSSAWTPAVSGAANTVRIDRAQPTAPTSVTGGSLAWQSVVSVTITATGGTDANFAGYDYRTSINGGPWSLATPGSSFAVTAEGTTIVQFRSRDAAGNVSAWTPAVAGAANTAAIDRTVPSVPTVTGGSLLWSAAASVTVSGVSIDPTSGILRYDYRTSINGGGTWLGATAAASGSISISAEGTTVVQFRAVDNAGNMSAWAPAAPNAGSTVKLDRIAPSLPVVTGGLGAGTCKHKLTVSAGGSTDAGSGSVTYDYRLSNGTPVINKISVVLTVTGTYIVQFRAVDLVGNTSAWAPAVAGSANTACIL